VNSTFKNIYLVQAVIGIVIWWSCTALSGVAEAWDADHYFSFGYPIMAVVAIGSGWSYGRGWSHGLVLMGSQALPLLTTVPSALNPYPDGMILLGLLSVPLVLLGAIASRLGRRRRAA
jgi:hypothetical protein